MIRPTGIEEVDNILLDFIEILDKSYNHAVIAAHKQKLPDAQRATLADCLEEILMQFASEKSYDRQINSNEYRSVLNRCPCCRKNGDWQDYDEDDTPEPPAAERVVAKKPAPKKKQSNKTKQTNKKGKSKRVTKQ
ncbi:hypothetical protein ACO2I3_01950 [Leptospira interrogans]